jgi:hypothetical protein
VLTDRYKRYNSLEFYKTFIEQTESLDMQLIDGHYDELQGFLESVYPSPFRVETEKNGELFFGYGIRMRNSDFGHSPFELSMFAFQIICYNGMQRNSVIREIHAGGRLPDNLILAEDTVKSDTHTRNLIARDAISTLMNPNSIKKSLEEIKRAGSISVDLDKEFKSLASRNKLGKNEIESLKGIVTNNRVIDGVQGENTLLKLSQAVGRLGSLNKNETRKRELDQLAYDLMVR